MKTVVVRIGCPTGGGDYPLELYVDDGSATWRERPRHTATIPAAPDDPPLPSEDSDHLSPFDRVTRFVLTESQQSQAFRDLGRWLYGLLARDAVGKAWEDLMQRYPGQPAPAEGLRTILDVEPEELRSVPWELSARGDRRLFLDPANPCHRGRLRPDPDPVPDLLPTRIMFVVGSTQEDVLADTEIDRILEALREFRGRVEWEILRSPSKKALMDGYGSWRPHVFHFIGHGGLSPGQGPVLELGDGSEEWDLPAEEVPALFGGWAGRVAILNACRTSAGGDEESGLEAHRAVTSMVSAFLDHRFGAVIGMQADVEAESAAAFSGPLYVALAKGRPLDVAVAEGRQSIYGVTALNRREWSLPSLTSSIAIDQVLAARVPMAEDEMERIDKRFGEIEAFVDRFPLRQELWLGVDPEGFDLKPRGLVVLYGPNDFGKTWLIWHCLRVCALRGRAVRYVELPEGQTLGFLDVLRRIRNEAPAAARGPGLPPEAFYRFNHELNALLSGREPPEYRPELGPVQDQGLPLKPGPENLRDRIITSFSEALRMAAGPGQLVLALDNLKMERSDFVGLYTHLLAPTRQGLLEQVRMIVAVGSDDYETMIPSQVREALLPIEVKGIERVQFARLAREYARYRKKDPAELTDLLELYQNHLPEFWAPVTLRDLFAHMA